MSIAGIRFPLQIFGNVRWSHCNSDYSSENLVTSAIPVPKQEWHNKPFQKKLADWSNGWLNFALYSCSIICTGDAVRCFWQCQSYRGQSIGWFPHMTSASRFQRWDCNAWRPCRVALALSSLLRSLSWPENLSLTTSHVRSCVYEGALTTSDHQPFSAWESSQRLPTSSDG